MRSREVIGSPVSITDYEEVLATIDQAIEHESRIYICCAPASSLVFARDDAQLSAALAAAAVVTPDGMGVVHATRLLGEELSGRVYGPDLMAAHCQRAAADGTPVFLYGGHDAATLGALEQALARRFPGLRIAGGISPPHRELTAEESADVNAQINSSGAQVVWVGLGSPKQELWMRQARSSLDAPVLIGVGAAFDFFGGRVAQAPSWMRRSGLEWLYRTSQDPLRLGRRYLFTLPRFAVLVVAQAIRERRQRVTK